MDETIYNLLFSLSFNEILCIEDFKLRKTLIIEYKKEKANLLNCYPDLIGYFDTSKSLEYNYHLLEELQSSSTSKYLFPGDKVLYYSIVEEFKARKEYMCGITGAIINVGSSYNQFKAFLYNKSQKVSYISNKIRYEIGSFDAPDSLHEFENFYYRVSNSYDLNLEEEYNIQTNIKGLHLRRLNNQKK